jgi:hypothetical protein
MAYRVEDKEGKKRLFLERLAAGDFVVEAAHAAGLTVETFYKWARQDHAFKKQWDKAYERGAEKRKAKLGHRDHKLFRAAKAAKAEAAAPRIVARSFPSPYGDTSGTPTLPLNPKLDRKRGDLLLPHDWSPREHQRKLYHHLERGIGIWPGDTSPLARRAVAVWHRRAGKDSVTMNFAAVAAKQRVGNYWHMFPTERQGRKALWEGVDRQGRRFIDQAFPRPFRTGKVETDMLLRLENGSPWQITGSDNFDRLVGANPVGVVFSEWALADPRARDYLRPILAENGGWAVFIYTARGRNHGAALYELAQKTPGWFQEKLTVDDTGVIAPGIVEDERRSGMAEEMIRQEYYCSFEAALVGAYFGPLMEAAERDSRIGEVPYDPNLPVITAWDLGIGDSTAIWFAQVSGGEIRLIDYYEAAGVGLDHYARILRERGYAYGDAFLPHDARQSELGTGRTRLETMRLLGIAGAQRIVPRLTVDDGINAARVILPRCRFDAARTARGIEALRQYRRAWHDERKMFADTPLHDWASHGADAFRYLAVGLREPASRLALTQTRAITDDDDRSPLARMELWPDAPRPARPLPKVELE